MIRPALLLTLAACAAASARAQDPRARADTLREADAVARAVEASPAARAALARLDAANAARRAGRSALVEAPELEADVVLGPNLLPESDGFATGATVGVTLERPAVRRARRAQADAAFGQATAEARSTLAALAFDVREAYVSAVAETAFSRLAVLLRADADTLAESVGLRYRAGDVSELDLRLAALDTLRAAAEAADALTRVAESRVRLAALVGLAPGALPPVGTFGPLAAADTAGADGRTGGAPASLAAAESAARAATAAARYARAQQRVPSFTVRGGVEYARRFYGRDDLRATPAIRDGFDRLGEAGLDVTLGVALPLPFGGPARREAALAATEASARAAEASAVGASLAADAAAARVRLRNAVAQQARYARARVDIEQSLGLLRLAYAGGEISLQDLLASRARLYETLQVALRADADVAFAALALARAVSPGLPVSERR